MRFNCVCVCVCVCVQVGHAGQGAIPRLVTLSEYVPPTSRVLQDWVVETEVCVCVSIYLTHMCDYMCMKQTSEKGTLGVPL